MGWLFLKATSLLCAVSLCGCVFDTMGLPTLGDAPVGEGVKVVDMTPSDSPAGDTGSGDTGGADTGPCKPAAYETCNKKDDDCDGQADITDKLHKLTYCPVQSPNKPIKGHATNYHCSRISKGAPPPGWTSGIAWFMAVFTGGAKDTGQVEIDWVRLYAMDDKGKTTVLTEEKKGKSGVDWMGYCPCSAWFKTDDHTGNDSLMTRDTETQKFELHKAKDQIWHFGGVRVPDKKDASNDISKSRPFPPKVKKVWMKARVRVTGKAMIRGGFDFWKNFAAQYSQPNGNNTEGAAGAWHVASSKWVTISAGDAE